MAVSPSVYPNRVIIALGSNVGNWKINFNQCLKKISNFGLITRIGNIYVSKPYGHVQQKNFHNTAIELMTNHSPLQLMRGLKLVEKVLKKNKTITNGPRRIDIDIVFYNQLVFQNNQLTIPHPRAFKRDFVLYPINDIDPFYFHPTKHKTIKSLIEGLNEKYIEKTIMQPRDSLLIR